MNLHNDPSTGTYTLLLAQGPTQYPQHRNLHSTQSTWIYTIPPAQGPTPLTQELTQYLLVHGLTHIAHGPTRYPLAHGPSQYPIAQVPTQCPLVKGPALYPLTRGPTQCRLAPDLQCVNPQLDIINFSMSIPRKRVHLTRLCQQVPEETRKTFIGRYSV